MKNLLNLGFVALFLVVLGCNCGKLRELANEGGRDNPPPSSSSPSSTASPSKSDAPSKAPRAGSTDAKGITRANYDKIEDDMSYADVVAILGKEGKKLSSSKIGKTVIVSYQWQGDGMDMIFCNFTDDKLTFKSEANLK